MAKQTQSSIDSHPNPFVSIDRSHWSQLAETETQPLTEAELANIQGIGDSIDLNEVKEVYLPLSKLISLYVESNRRLHQATSNFLAEPIQPTTFVLGIAGSVAVGKSTIARLLRDLLRRWDSSPRVELVTTDGFLFSNAELERRGIMDRKGFPESYDRRSLLRFISEVKSGVKESRAPFYSHLVYDIVPKSEIIVNQPDVLIIEGLNVLQPAPTGHTLAVSDLFDFSIYVDAKTEEIENWFVQRFMQLKNSAFTDPRSYFNRFTSLTDEEALEQAKGFWHGINKPNLVENILPTKARANLVLRKGKEHSVERILLRKL